jgi:Tfp pilus assembly protein PilF
MILSSLFGTVLKQVGMARRARRTAHLLERAIQLHKEGDWEEARRRYEEVLSEDPHNADANYLIGIVHARCERYEAAEWHLCRAIALRPQFADAHIDLGNVYRMQNNKAAAEASYRNALALAPDAVLAHLNLARLLLESGRVDEVLDHLRSARELEPTRDDILRNLVTMLVESGQYAEAVQVAESAAAKFPASYDVQMCLGLAYQKSHRVAEAMECYDRALGMRDDDPELHNNRGTQLQEMGRLDEALASYERALELRPDFPLARFHRGLARLMAGDYARGWVDYEARLLSVMQPPRSSHFARWNGEPLKGRTLLIYGEQGLGDEIMFASCLPEIVEEAGHCIIECSPKLERLFARSFPGTTVYSWQWDGRTPAAGRSYGADFEVPISSLPLYRRRTASDFPEHRGYLIADLLRVQHWRDRLTGLGPGLKVGISWRGGTYKTRTSKRSIPLEKWLPIFQSPGVHFVSLQYTEDAAEELQALHDQHGVQVVHWREAIDDYDETAALVTALDLIVSVCTAVIHLGGALGRPVWVMVPYGPEWRYGIRGETMPWYPSVRLFRQPAMNEWDPVIERVALELRRIARVERGR